MADLRDQYTSEADLATVHVVQSFIGFIKLELFNHAFHTMDLSKVDGVFTVHSMA